MRVAMGTLESDTVIPGICYHSGVWFPSTTLDVTTLLLPLVEHKAMWGEPEQYTQIEWHALLV